MADIDNEIEDETEEGAEGETAPEVEETDTEEDESSEESDDSDESPEEGSPETSKSAAEPEKKESRESRRVVALSKRARDAEERAIRAEAIAEERASKPNINNNAEAKRIRDEKLALMDDVEKKDFLRDEALENMHQTVLLTQLQTQDTLDRSSYQTAAARNPVYAKHGAEVERRLSAERQQGRNWGRETILAQILGEAALKAKPDKKKKEEAQERVNSSKSAPVKGRSNTTGYRPGRTGESLDDLERRLENVTF